MNDFQSQIYINSYESDTKVNVFTKIIKGTILQVALESVRDCGRYLWSRICFNVTGAEKKVTNVW